MAEFDLTGRPVAPRQRFRPGSRVGVRAWIPREEACLWAVRREAGTIEADVECCEFLCDALGHPGKVPEHEPPYKKAAERVSLINDRMVTAHITARSKDVTALMATLYDGSRSPLNFTWAEVSLARAWVRDPNDVGRLEASEFLWYLDRDAVSLPLLRAATKAYLPDDPSKRPCRPDNAARVASSCAAFCHLPADAPPTEVRAAWRSLCAVCRE